MFELVHAEDKAEGRRKAWFRDTTIADDERLEHGAVVEGAGALVGDAVGAAAALREPHGDVEDLQPLRQRGVDVAESALHIGDLVAQPLLLLAQHHHVDRACIVGVEQLAALRIQFRHPLGLEVALGDVALLAGHQLRLQPGAETLGHVRT